MTETIYSRLLPPPPPARVLSGAVETETLVIGGGLAGLSTAVALAERGRPVLLLEAKRVGWGASGRNGGFLSAGYPLEYDEIAQRLGLEDARALRRLAVEAVDWIEGLIVRHGLDCGPHPRGHLGCLWHEEPEAARAEVARQNELYGFAYRYLPREEMAAITSSPFHRGGVLDPAGTQIQPLAYCRGLAAVLGERVHEETPALGLERRGAAWRVTTPAGAVTARNLVLCAGGYLGRLHPKLARCLVPVSTHIAATKPFGAERLARAIRGAYALGDHRRAGAYYRPLADTRLVWGGRLTLPWERGGQTGAAIARWIERIYPALGPVEMELGWSGLMSFGRSRMVQLGQLPDGAWYAFGFGGSGLGSTAVAGRLLAAALAEEDDEYRRFAPFGLGWTGGPLGPLAARLVYSGYRVADWLQDRRAARGSKR